ncbi:MAG TPA: ATP-binding protein, partial [Pyrinomonadaceae bacterium]
MSDARTLPESPYIGLVPYTEQDAPFFFGREKERDIIIENLRASRLTLLYGPSGVGKSSVLNAGVSHRLHRMAHECVQEYGLPEFAVVNFRNWSDAPLTRFIQAAHESVAKALQIDAIEPVPHGTLVEMLQALTERFGLELLIILDQFEENFNLHPLQKDEDDFIAQLPDAINNLNLRAKFLISLRDDSLSKLDRFKTSIPQLLDNRLSLKHMNAEGARAAIQKPISAYNELLAPGEPEYRIEPELVEEILKQIIDSQETTAQITENEADNKLEAVRIEAVYLQLVMERLWESDKQQRILRSSTLDNMKGLKNIVQDYLNKALTEKLDASQQDIAARIFKYLVTPSGIKIPYTKSDLHNQVEVETNELDAVLTALNQARILKEVDPPLDQPDESRYEIFHDKLAAAILKWRSDYEQKKKLVETEKKKEKELAEAEAKRIEAEQKKASELAEAEQKRLAAEQAQRRRRTIIVLSCLVAVFLGAAVIAISGWVYVDNINDELKREKELLDEEKKSTNNLTVNLREKNEEIERKKMESDLSILLDDNSLDANTREAIIKILNRSGVNNPKFDNPENNPNKIMPENDDPIARTRWRTGQTIHIRFIGGSPAVRK